ncbi:MAG TPA: phenylalanine--tRNA ligase subunit beta, partial [Candidatus Dormibacteraeota bacterium]|nr:phenylalanine--tRNA ligase subunit beta [Candidatus Dormibacteraeota bacterium]
LSVASHTAGGAADAAQVLRHVQAVLSRVAEEIAGAVLSTDPAEVSGARRGRAARLRAGSQAAGIVADLHPDTVERFGLRGRVLVGELNLDALPRPSRSVPHFKAPPRFPAVVQDVAVIVDANRTAAQALEVIRGAAGPWLEAAELYDEYRGSNLDADRKGWTFRLTYRAADRTLTSEEVQQVQQRIVDALRERCGAELRH